MLQKGGMHMWNWVISILSFCLLMGSSMPDLMPCTVVTEITVQWEIEGHAKSQRYTQQGKMNKVLNYLRSLDPMPVNEIPDDAVTTEYFIRLQRSDGTSIQFIQRGITNFRKEDGAWEAVDPEDAIRLPLLLAAIPGDF